MATSPCGLFSSGSRNGPTYCISTDVSGLSPANADIIRRVGRPSELVARRYDILVREADIEEKVARFGVVVASAFHTTAA